MNRAGGWHDDGLRERGFSVSLPVSDWLRLRIRERQEGSVTDEKKDDRGVHYRQTTQSHRLDFSTVFRNFQVKACLFESDCGF